MESLDPAVLEHIVSTRQDADELFRDGGILKSELEYYLDMQDKDKLTQILFEMSDGLENELFTAQHRYEHDKLRLKQIIDNLSLRVC